MADAKTEQEPSIEEILESIRQIISDDSAPAAAAAEPAPAPAPAPAVPPAAATAPVTPPPAPAPAAALSFSDDMEEDDGILDLTEKVDIRPADIDLQEHIDMPQNDASALLSDITTDAAASAMAKLLAGNVAVERDVPGRVGSVTLEDMARDLMRPLVKTWLDQNLPRIIEKMVAKEIEKISRLAMKQ